MCKQQKNVYILEFIFLFHQIWNFNTSLYKMMNQYQIETNQTTWDLHLISLITWVY